MTLPSCTAPLPRPLQFSSGTTVRSAPAGSDLGFQNLRDQSAQVMRRGPRSSQRVPVLAAVGGQGVARSVSVWAARPASGSSQPSTTTRSLLQHLRASAAPAEAAKGGAEAEAEAGLGRVVVYGDSNCADTAQLDRDCYGFVDNMLAWAAGGEWAAGLQLSRQAQPYAAPPMDTGVAERHPKAQLPRSSRVLAPGARPCSG